MEVLVVHHAPGSGSHDDGVHEQGGGMRTALVLPLSAVVVASAGLSLPVPPGQPSGPSWADTSTTMGAARAVDLDRVEAPRTARGPATTGGPAAVGLPRSPAALQGRWGRWEWPLSPQPAVLRAFVRPVTAYGAGHRGLDLAGSPGQEVLAVDAGTVTHVGTVAGRGTVTVLHASGVRSTYEPVATGVAHGEAVTRGTRLGELAAGGSHCRPGCLHLGAVRDRTYLDPLVLLTGGRRVRLLPLGQVPLAQAPLAHTPLSQAPDG